MKRIGLAAFVIMLSLFKSFGQTAPDSCITPYQIFRNTPVSNEGTTVVDEACFEVVLDEGFETPDNVDYTAQVGNSGEFNPPITFTNNGGEEDILLLLRGNSSNVALRWIPDLAQNWLKAANAVYEIQRQEYVNNEWSDSTTIAVINTFSKSDSLTWLNNPDSLYSVVYYATKDEAGTAVGSIDPEDLFFMYYAASSAYNINFQLAQDAGHGFIDNSVSPNKRYRYRVVAKDGAWEIDSGDFIEVETSDSGVLPQSDVVLSDLESSQKPSVSVSWEAESLMQYYASYNVLRSVDGVNFEKINNLPIVFIDEYFDADSGINRSLDSIRIGDTLSNSTQQYYYKVQAHSYFNEDVDFDVAQILVKKRYLYSPGIDSVYAVTPTTSKIKWRYPYEGDDPLLNSDLKTSSWQIWVANKDTVTDYNTLGSLLNRTTRSYSFNNSSLASVVDTSQSYFFKVSAITTENDTLWSFSHLVVPEDHTPPAKPTGLVISDTLLTADNRMVLELTWNANTENDLEGYLLRRGIGENDTLEVISSPKYIYDNDTTKALKADLSAAARIVRDTLALNMILPEINYVLTAVDGNNNESDTTVVRFAMLDTLRPMPPLIRRARVDVTTGGNDAIFLSLTFSPETGTTHKLLKSSSLGLPWTEAEVISFAPNDRDTLYIDSNVISGIEYYYSFMAIDEAGNESCFQELRSTFSGDYTEEECYQFVRISLRDSTSKPGVLNNLEAESISLEESIRLTWDVAPAYSDQIVEFEIYKAAYEEGVDLSAVKESLYKVVSRFDNEFIDSEPISGSINRFMIRAVLLNSLDGSTSLSDWKEVEVNY